VTSIVFLYFSRFWYFCFLPFYPKLENWKKADFWFFVFYPKNEKWKTIVNLFCGQKRKTENALFPFCKCRFEKRKTANLVLPRVPYSTSSLKAMEEWQPVNAQLANSITNE
jgi:hypothetical protein